MARPVQFRSATLVAVLLAVAGGARGGGFLGHGAFEPIEEHSSVFHEAPSPPQVKVIRVPVPQPVPVAVPQPVAVAVPHPVPVYHREVQRVQVPVTRTVQVERERPYPVYVEKRVPVPVDKPYPITVKKPVAVPVPKPYPVRVPVYKHVYHNIGGGGGHGQGW
ncbi:proline-rich protein 4-like [Schistocerca piceifrons]|uniref:proline-rich protein 4-like n=1 Tax=Schistocerca piceifrons TaxID=274613 RepID=UPI001F5F0AE3|nr:proline-rich protein 4-like [Schistocerca piceifrons]